MSWFNELKRPQLDLKDLEKATEAVVNRIGVRLDEKGKGAFVSQHEALGIIAEEYKELIEAVQSNVDQDVADELIDVAVASVIAVASMVAGARRNSELAEKVNEEFRFSPGE